MSDNKIRIALVDDHPLMREGVASTLASEADFDIVGQGENAKDAIRLAKDLLPDLILLDISMAGCGIEAARAISADYPVIKIIMLTAADQEESVLAALKAGARGYVLKGVSGSELINIVRSVWIGETYITPKLAASLLVDSRDSHSQQQDPLAELTKREREILELLSEGQSNKQIAAALNLSEKTVKHYMTNILSKLQVRNRVEAALLAQSRL